MIRRAEITVEFLCLATSPLSVFPDRPFHNFRASRSGDRQIKCSSKTPCNGLWSSKVMKESVGLAEAFYSWRVLVERLAYLGKDVWWFGQLSRNQLGMYISCTSVVLKFSFSISKRSLVRKWTEHQFVRGTILFSALRTLETRNWFPEHFKLIGLS